MTNETAQSASLSSVEEAVNRMRTAMERIKNATAVRKAAVQEFEQFYHKLKEKRDGIPNGYGATESAPATSDSKEKNFAFKKTDYTGAWSLPAIPSFGGFGAAAAAFNAAAGAVPFPSFPRAVPSEQSEADKEAYKKQLEKLKSYFKDFDWKDFPDKFKKSENTDAAGYAEKNPFNAAWFEDFDFPSALTAPEKEKVPSLYDREYPEAPFKAPMIAASTDEAVLPLITYIAGLRKNALRAGQQEARRLQSYFLNCSSYLTIALQATARNYSADTYNRLAQLCQPNALAGLFEAVTQKTRNTVLSEAIILPEKVVKDFHLKNTILEGTRSFLPSYKYRGLSLTFGFVQVFQKTAAGREYASAAFPVLGLDDKALGILSAHKPEKLLRHLQDGITWMNHDMLHHYSNEIINQDVAKKFERNLNSPVHKWAKTFDPGLFGEGEKGPHGYETWSLMTHARMKAFADYADMERTVDNFFDELDRIADALKEDALSEPGNPGRCEAKWRETHEVVDYLGMMMGFAVMRMVPMDHPLMNRFLDRMERADFAHEITEKVLATEFGISDLAAFDRDNMFNYATIAPSLEGGGLFDGFDSLRRKFREALANYKAANPDFLPKKGEPLTYRQTRQLQMALFDPRIALLHSPHVKLESEFNGGFKEAGPRMLQLVDAAAESTGYQPRPIRGLLPAAKP